VRDVIVSHLISGSGVAVVLDDLGMSSSKVALSVSFFGCRLVRKTVFTLQYVDVCLHKLDKKRNKKYFVLGPSCFNVIDSSTL
jgi:hypothetical protein